MTPFAPDRPELAVVQHAEWPQCIEEADFIVVTCAAYPQYSRHMLNAEVLAKAKPAYAWSSSAVARGSTNYGADRKAATWTQALQVALVRLNVAVIQGTSDEATALRRHVEGELDAHHSPDLFHGLHEVSKATSLHLVRQSDATVAAAQTRWAVERATQQACEDQSPRPCGRPPAFAARIHAALSEVLQAEIAHTPAQARQCEARELMRELGILYHPYDFERGQAQPVEQVAQRLNGVWTRLGSIAAAAELPTSARERLAKEQRLSPQLLATITFFFATLQGQVDAFVLPLTLERTLVEQLIPALYLERVAARSTHAKSRHRRRTLSRQLHDHKLLKRFLAHGAALPKEELARLGCNAQSTAKQLVWGMWNVGGSLEESA
jgi:hypothetical protein